MNATALTLFQVRVMLSSGAMLRMPSAAPITNSAGVPSSSSSAVGTLRVPSLSFSRLMLIPFNWPLSSRSSR